MFIFHLHFIAAALIIITRWFANSSLHCVLCYMLLALWIMMNPKQKKTFKNFPSSTCKFWLGVVKSLYVCVVWRKFIRLPFSTMQDVYLQNKQLCLLWTLSRKAQHLLSFQNTWNYRVHQRHCLHYTDIPFSSKYLWDHNNYVEYNISFTQTQIPKTKGNIMKANCSCSP